MNLRVNYDKNILLSLSIKRPVMLITMTEYTTEKYYRKSYQSFIFDGL